MSTPIVPVEAARAAQMNGGDASPGVRESVAVMPVGTVVFRAASGPQRWRIRPPGAIEGSKDAGRSWTVEYNDPQLRLVSGAVTPQNTCWMVGEQGAVLRLRRNQSWERVAAPTSRKLLSVAATDDTSAVVADDQGAMYRTTDGGTTWQPFKP